MYAIDTGENFPKGKAAVVWAEGVIERGAFLRNELPFPSLHVSGFLHAHLPCWQQAQVARRYTQDFLDSGCPLRLPYPVISHGPGGGLCHTLDLVHTDRLTESFVLWEKISFYLPREIWNL